MRSVGQSPTEIHHMLEGKTVLVVGGSSGIGLAVASLAHKNGAQVVIASRNALKHRDKLANSLGKTLRVHSFDITSDEDVRGLFQATGRIDHLVVTVRPDLQSSLFLETQISEAKQAFDTKFWGPYCLVREAQPYIGQGGSITLTSGIAGERIYKGASTMATVNSAIETLCRALAVELAPLRVNVVSPGFVEPKPRGVQEYAGQFPARRLASAEDVARAYLHLMTSPYMTGSISVVDGGARLI